MRDILNNAFASEGFSLTEKQNEQFGCSFCFFAQKI